MSARRRVTAALCVAALATGALVTSCSGDEGDSQASGRGDDRPNIVFIVADDMNVTDLASLPALGEWLGDEGTSFTNAFVSVSLCCPSRVTMLRGQYAHNTGVLHNEGLSGGFPVAHDLGVEDSTVATWLGAEGYRTGLFGNRGQQRPQLRSRRRDFGQQGRRQFHRSDEVVRPHIVARVEHLRDISTGAGTDDS